MMEFPLTALAVNYFSAEGAMEVDKLNVEHRTSNIECLMKGCFSFDVGRSMFDVI
jgi:hypothetical protein